MALGKSVRRGRLQWSWGQSLYKIQYEEKEVKVALPSCKEQRGGILFTLEWETGQIYCARRDPNNVRFELRLNGNLKGEIFPCIHFGDFLSKKPFRSDVVLFEPLLRLTLSQGNYWGLPTSEYSIIDERGGRKCYWKMLSCALGGPSAIILIPVCIEAKLVPWFITIAILCLVTTSGPE